MLVARVNVDYITIKYGTTEKVLGTKEMRLKRQTLTSSKLLRIYKETTRKTQGNHKETTRKQLGDH